MSESMTLATSSANRALSQPLTDFSITVSLTSCECQKYTVQGSKVQPQLPPGLSCVCSIVLGAGVCVVIASAPQAGVAGEGGTLLMRLAPSQLTPGVSQWLLIPSHWTPSL